MSSEFSDNEIQKRIDSVLEAAGAIAGTFPPLKLRNRLLNLGLEEFVDEAIVEERGFPFKFFTQLDEAILTLAHFLDRFKKEGGTLEVCAINKLVHGEEKHLSFWQDAKAKLYLELQNMVLLLDDSDFTPSDGGETSKRRSRISRIFAFPQLSDLAFLSQAGINVLGEQLAAKVNLGFLFLNRFQRTEAIRPVSNTLLIIYNPSKKTPDRHNIYELYGLRDESLRYDLPYRERCSAKWYTSDGWQEAIADIPENRRRREILALFINESDEFDQRPKEWRSVEVANESFVCKFDQSSGEFFNDAMLMMFKAYDRSDISKEIGNNEFIINRINKTVITRDMIRLQRAMSSFTDAIDIRAVDATSTKNSLNIHESSPVYRDWLRRSLNRVLRSDDKTLQRIYILKDDVGEKDIETEYQALLRLMQYYLDYLHYDVSDMAEIVGRHANQPQSISLGTDEWWKNLTGRVRLFITTSRVLGRFTERVLTLPNYAATFKEIFRNPSTESKKKKERSYSVFKYKDLRRLDYLYARYEIEEDTNNPQKRVRHMIYNFLNPRADTGELSFPAFLYRANLSITDEENRLFGFLNCGMGKDEGLQSQHRVNLLAISLLQYEGTYNNEDNRILEAEVNTYRDDLKSIRTQLKSKTGDVKIDSRTLLDIRIAFEQRLYNYFAPRFTYLYDVLKYMSLEVEFKNGKDTSKISQIEPFVNCHDKSIRVFTDTIMKSVRKQLDKGLEVPDAGNYGIEGLGPTDSSSREIANGKKWKLFLSYAHTDRSKVEDVFDRLKAVGFDPWMDTLIFGGEDWNDRIETELRQSDFNLLFLSEVYVQRRGPIQLEVTRALYQQQQMLRDDIKLIPVRLERVDPPAHLSHLQWVDLFESDGFERLVKAIREGIRRRAKGS